MGVNVSSMQENQLSLVTLQFPRTPNLHLPVYKSVIIVKVSLNDAENNIFVSLLN